MDWVLVRQVNAYGGVQRVTCLRLRWHVKTICNLLATVNHLVLEYSENQKSKSFFFLSFFDTPKEQVLSLQLGCSAKASSDIIRKKE